MPQGAALTERKTKNHNIEKLKEKLSKSIGQY
jgi:hypothetical protein